MTSAAQRTAIAAFDVDGPLSSTLGNFEGSVPPPTRVEQRMFDVLDPDSVSDVMAVRKRILARPPAAAALSRKEYENDVKFEIAYYRAGGLLTQGPDPTGYGPTIAGFGDQRRQKTVGSIAVFKDGVGYDSAKIVQSVKGIAGRQ